MIRVVVAGALSVACGCGASRTETGATQSFVHPTLPFIRVTQTPEVAALVASGVSAHTRNDVGPQCPHAYVDDRSVVECHGRVVSLRAPVEENVFAHARRRGTRMGGDRSSHVCALLSTGSVACWGDDSFGQLGDGAARRDTHEPLELEGLPGVVDIDSGPLHVCALGGDGTVWCWGSNLDGQLGDDGRTTRSQPVRVRGLEGVTPVALALGSNHSCALLADGRLACWGAPWAYGERDDRRTAHVIALPRPIVEISAGDDITCVRDDASELWCGGRGLVGASS